MPDGNSESDDLVIPLPEPTSTPTPLTDPSNPPLDDAEHIIFSEDFEGSSPNLFDEVGCNQYPCLYADDIWFSSSDPWLPVNGHSHPTAAITVPFGDYHNSAYALLYTGLIDFTNTSHATLTFNLFFEIEQGFDGLQVLTTTDEGITWELLMPEQGYTGMVGLFEPAPAYTGNLNEWWPVSFDLSHLSGNIFIIAFLFGSDSSVTAPGAAIDDIVISTQGISPQEGGEPGALSGITPPDGLFEQPKSIEDPHIPWAQTETMANCREGTDQAFQVLSTLYRGQSVPIKAVNPDRSWLFVYDTEKNIFCWVWSDLMVLPGSLDELPELPDPVPPETPPDSEDSNGDQLLCSPTLPAAECSAAGGTPQINALPICKCP
jgi:hypothetical protein